MCEAVSVAYAFGVVFFFFKQKTAYEIPKRDWSSDVCSSDLWLVSNWNAILHEERLTCALRTSDARTSYFEAVIPNLAAFSDEDTQGQPESWDQWWSRLALLSQRDGGLLPDLFVHCW